MRRLLTAGDGGNSFVPAKNIVTHGGPSSLRIIAGNAVTHVLGCSYIRLQWVVSHTPPTANSNNCNSNKNNISSNSQQLQRLSYNDRRLLRSRKRGLAFGREKNCLCSALFCNCSAPEIPLLHSSYIVLVVPGAPGSVHRFEKSPRYQSIRA